jgi:O-methyltransferase
MLKSQIKRFLHKNTLRIARRLETKDPAVENRMEAGGLDEQTTILWNIVKSRTMTSIYRVDALRESVEYINSNNIAGDIVECGVWRGGSTLAVALTLQRLGTERILWLFDTFEGMPEPGSEDIDFNGRAALDIMVEQAPRTSDGWLKSSLGEVKSGFDEIGYPNNLVNYVVGPVETTIPQNAPRKIALLRLDTDWFSSTYHELVHLWPRLSDRGILIIDDYGHWVGAKKAVDQYFNEIGIRPLLHRIDETGRLVIKFSASAEL